MIVVTTKIERVAVDKLIPYVNNARTHSQHQVAQVAASIREYGFTNPVLIDKDNGIIAGHGRVQAAQKLEMTDVPCIRLDLTEAQKKAYILADNKLALNAGWDEELLALELAELGDMGFGLELTGFDLDEIDALKQPDFGPASDDEQGKLDQLDPKWVACPHCGKEFDLREQS